MVCFLFMSRGLEEGKWDRGAFFQLFPNPAFCDLQLSALSARTANMPSALNAVVFRLPNIAIQSPTSLWHDIITSPRFTVCRCGSAVSPRFDFCNEYLGTLSSCFDMLVHIHIVAPATYTRDRAIHACHRHHTLHQDDAASTTADSQCPTAWIISDGNRETSIDGDA